MTSQQVRVDAIGLISGYSVDNQTGSTVAVVVSRSVEDAVMLFEPSAAASRRCRRSVLPSTPAATSVSSDALRYDQIGPTGPA